mgnify:CR=1 FL=1
MVNYKTIKHLFALYDDIYSFITIFFTSLENSKNAFHFLKFMDLPFHYFTVYVYYYISINILPYISI